MPWILLCLTALIYLTKPLSLKFRPIGPSIVLHFVSLVYSINLKILWQERKERITLRKKYHLNLRLSSALQSFIMSLDLKPACFGSLPVLSQSFLATAKSWTHLTIRYLLSTKLQTDKDVNNIELTFTRQHDLLYAQVCSTNLNCNCKCVHNLFTASKKCWPSVIRTNWS